jgi:hypothetical protein
MAISEDGVGEADEGKVVRPTAGSVRVRLAEAGLDVPEQCVPGTVANLIVLQDHVATLRGFALDYRSRSALKFEP